MAKLFSFQDVLVICKSCKTTNLSPKGENEVMTGGSTKDGSFTVWQT